MYMWFCFIESRSRIMNSIFHELSMYTMRKLSGSIYLEPFIAKKSSDYMMTAVQETKYKSEIRNVDDIIIIYIT